jgi:DNA-binding MarR family transcriptional regulator
MKKLSVFDCLCHNLRKTSRQLTQYYDEALRPAGLRITQFTLMAAVEEMREVAFIPLADFLGLDRTTLARNVEILVRDGLVYVEVGVHDRRLQVVRLTELGTSRLQAARPLWEGAQRTALHRIGELEPLLAQLAELEKVGGEA